MAVADGKVKQRLVEYVLEHGDDLAFTKYFWKECEFLPPDVVQYGRFAEAQRLIRQGRTQLEIAEHVGVSKSTAYSWSRVGMMPKLCHYLAAFLTLGNPIGSNVWLTLEQTHGHGVPIGQFIQVPTAIHSWQDIDDVIRNIVPLGDPLTGLSREYLFGFLIGIIIGDAHKPKQGHSHRHIDLTLSKKYETNVKIGDFTTLCARQFGLRMERFEDIPKPENKPHGFFNWRSQSSPLIDWIFNVVIGLNYGQHTTYDSIHMDWAFDSPRDFRIGLVQGIAESDGSVSVASQTVEFWVIPDWDFMIKLLASHGLRAFRNREAVSLVKRQAILSFGIPVFSEQLRTVRYQLLQLLATTPKLERKDRLPEFVRAEIARLAVEGYSVPRIIEQVARSHSLLVSFEAAQRWARKALRGKSGGGQDNSHHEKY